jgi:ferritin-like metal-binding protein YciE
MRDSLGILAESSVMDPKTLNEVLANWLTQAIGSEDRLPKGMTPATWAAQRTAEWLDAAASGPLTEAEEATHRLKASLERLGGWDRAELANAMEELTHLSDAVADLRTQLGLQAQRQNLP